MAAAAAAADRTLLLASFAASPADVGDARLPPAAALLPQGDYTGALAAALAAAWAAAVPQGAAPESTPDWFDAAAPAFAQLLASEPAAQAAEQLLVAAVAALHLFLQANLSGPASLALPECPFELLDAAAAAEWQQQNAAAAPGGGAAGGGADSDAAAAPSAGFGRDSTSPGDRWAAAQLSESGEDLVGRIRLPQYLLLARLVLLAPLTVVQPGAAPAGTAARVTLPAWLAARLPSWPWWALRAVLLQQRLLSGLSASLRSLLLGLAQLVLAAYAAPMEQGSGGGDPMPEDQLLAAGALLEAALLETAYGHVATAKEYLQRSGAVLGFHSGEGEWESTAVRAPGRRARCCRAGSLGLRESADGQACCHHLPPTYPPAELTGALGVRTVHQQEAKAQLLVSVSRQGGNPWTAAHAAGALPDRAEEQAALEAASHGPAELPAELKGFTADSDVLPHPQLAAGQEGRTAPADLHSLEQALLLGWCLHVRKGSAADGLQPWEMAAYVDARECMHACI